MQLVIFFCKATIMNNKFCSHFGITYAVRKFVMVCKHCCVQNKFMKIQSTYNKGLHCFTQQSRIAHLLLFAFFGYVSAPTMFNCDNMIGINSAFCPLTFKKVFTFLLHVHIINERILPKKYKFCVKMVKFVRKYN